MNRSSRIITAGTAVLLSIAIMAGCSSDQSGSKGTFVRLEPDPFSARAAEETAVDIISYDMDLTLDTDHDRLMQTVKMRVRNNTDETAETVYLRYDPLGYFDFAAKEHPERKTDNEGKRAELVSVKIEDSDAELSVEYGMENTSVRIRLGDAAIRPGEEGIIITEAWTDIPAGEERFSLVEREEGKLYQLAFCYPHVECSLDGRWVVDPPTFDEGENRNSALADYLITIHAPEEYEIAAPGSKERSGSTATFSIEHARDIAVIISNFMGVDTFETQRVTVSSYYLQTKAQDDYRELERQFITDAITGFSNRYGSFPRDRMAVVEGTDGGMEYSGLATVDGNPFLNQKSEDYNKTFRNTVHEIGHAWFYDCMGNVEYREGWVDEGLVSFAANDDILMMDCRSYEMLRKYNKNNPDVKEYTDARNSVMKMNVKNIKGYDNYYINEPRDVHDSEGALGTKEYVYAPLFLRQAREIMGDEAFFACLKDVYHTYIWKTADTKGIIEIFRMHNRSDKLSELISFYFTGV